MILVVLEERVALIGGNRVEIFLLDGRLLRGGLGCGVDERTIRLERELRLEAQHHINLGNLRIVILNGRLVLRLDRGQFRIIDGADGRLQVGLDIGNGRFVGRLFLFIGGAFFIGDGRIRQKRIKLGVARLQRRAIVDGADHRLLVGIVCGQAGARPPVRLVDGAVGVTQIPNQQVLHLGLGEILVVDPVGLHRIGDQPLVADELVDIRHLVDGLVVICRLVIDRLFLRGERGLIGTDEVTFLGRGLGGLGGAGKVEGRGEILVTLVGQRVGKA